MTSEVLLHKRDDRIAVVTLNRPQALNAIDRAMAVALRKTIRDVETDDAVDAVIFTGAGERAFCVGVDLKERQALSDEEADKLRMGELFPMYRELEQKTKPSIALVNGQCLAGGFELALCCDMILATPGAKFGLPEVKWGLIPAGGGCRKLPKLIGMVRAKEMIFTAKPITAQEAERIGIINRIVAAENAMAEALELARQVLANVQVAVRGAKRCHRLCFGLRANHRLRSRGCQPLLRRQGAKARHFQLRQPKVGAVLSFRRRMKSEMQRIAVIGAGAMGRQIAVAMRSARRGGHAERQHGGQSASGGKIHARIFGRPGRQGTHHRRAKSRLRSPGCVSRPTLPPRQATSAWSSRPLSSSSSPRPRCSASSTGCVRPMRSWRPTARTSAARGWPQLPDAPSASSICISSTPRW